MNTLTKTVLMPATVIAAGAMSNTAYAWGNDASYTVVTHHTVTYCYQNCERYYHKPKPKPQRPRKTCQQSYNELIAKARKLERIAKQREHHCQFAQAQRLRATAAKLRRLAQKLPCAC